VRSRNLTVAHDLKRQRFQGLQLYWTINAAVLALQLSPLRANPLARSGHLFLNTQLMVWVCDRG